MKKPKFNFLKKLFKKNKENIDDYEDRYHDDSEELEYEEEYEEEDEDFTPSEMTINKDKIEEELEEDTTSPGFEAPSELESTAPRFKLPKLNPKAKALAAKDKVTSKFKGLLSKKGKTKSSLPSSGGFDFKAWISQIDFDSIYQNIFAVESRKKIHAGFLGLTLLSSTYMVGKLSALGLSKLIKPKESKSLSVPSVAVANLRPDLENVKIKDLFNAIGESPKGPILRSTKPKIDTTLVCETSKTKSSLPIKLLNTIVLQDTVKSVASVQVRSNKSIQAIREGDEVKGLAKVGRIERLRMIFKNLKNGKCEYVANIDKKVETMFERQKPKIYSAKKGKKLLETKQGDIKNVGNTFKIKKTARDEALANIGEILTQARAVQFKNPDGSLSFKMTEIIPGSIYSKLNIQDGDIITSINGKKIENLNQVMSLFGKIRDIDHFELSINRGGNDQTMEYDFE